MRLGWASLNFIVVLGLTSPIACADSSRIGPAPSGLPLSVATMAIHNNFDPPICPKVVKAFRAPDNSVRAKCSDGETFMIFSLDGKGVAMRCSAAEAIGVTGCY